MISIQVSVLKWSFQFEHLYWCLQLVFFLSRLCDLQFELPSSNLIN
jgi:hypothetical protein